MIENEQLSRTKSKRLKLIVDVSYKIFLKKGISDTSINDIAEECNITRRTIYNYFDSKIDLLDYLMIMVAESVAKDFHIEYDDKMSGIDNMRKMLNTNFEAYYKHINDFLFITQVRTWLSHHQQGDSRNEKVSIMQQSFINEIANIIEKGYEDGTITGYESMSKEDKAKLIHQATYGYLSNIGAGIAKISKEKYYTKCRHFENMVIGFLVNN